MRIQADVTPQEFSDFVAELFPATVLLDDDDKSKSLELHDPRDIRFDASGGAIEVTLSGKVRWPIPVLETQSFRVSCVQARFKPHVQREGARASLVFHFEIGGLDVHLVPKAIDKALLSRINKAIGRNNIEFAWDFSQTLSNRVDIPEQLEPATAVGMYVSDGKVELHDDRLHLEVPMVFHVLQSDVEPASMTA